MVVINCASARARNHNYLNEHEKRLFGCGALGTSCSGLFSKSCCNGFKCHSTTGKCVSSGGSSNWLGDRNGK
ncbi:unnamed protein product [Rotaria socialis]|nr:unnamed protein product [Rotaria socialis]CAF3439342.1 unnamed protein product [Rotaria socialis]CAF3619105.1 unnamed protein product [Rotaria socialis]